MQNKVVQFFSFGDFTNKLFMLYNKQAPYRGIAQLVEQWSPKPRAEGSNPSAPANVQAGKPVSADIAQ